MTYYKDPNWEFTHIITTDHLLEATREKLSKMENEINIQFREIYETINILIDETRKMQKILGHEYD